MSAITTKSGQTPLTITMAGNPGLRRASALGLACQCGGFQQSRSGCDGAFAMSLQDTATQNVYNLAGTFKENCGPNNVTTYTVTNGTFTYKKNSADVVRIDANAKFKGTAGKHKGSILTHTYKATMQ